MSRGKGGSKGIGGMGAMDAGREWAETCKTDGNVCFQKSEWEKAISFYEEGVAAVDSMMMNPADDIKVACFSNIAAAYLKLERLVTPRPATVDTWRHTGADQQRRVDVSREMMRRV